MDSREIHQVLHGYHDGHRLLASSISLPPKSDQILVVLSDLSGHSVVNSFDEYITGYPLPEMGVYALAKTWFAKEMPRPGCVFTHTLLVPFALLASISDLHHLTKLFSRPTVNETTSFKHSLTIPPTESKQNEVKYSDSDLANLKEILLALYNSPTKPLLVPVQTPSEIELFFFSLWSQQWPRLRRSFTFCTGAISARQIEKRWFDLQATPLKKTDDILRSINDSVVVHFERNTINNLSPKWCNEALKDISSKTKSLRTFLYEYGAEAEGGRIDYIPLTQLFLAISRNTTTSIEDTLESLDLLFPIPSLGRKFKEQLLSGIVSSKTFSAPETRLKLILDSSNYFLFDLRDDFLEQLVNEAWSTNQDAVLNSIEATLDSSSDFFPMITSTVAQLVTPKDFSKKRHTPEVVMALAHWKPVLLADHGFQNLKGRNSALSEYILGPNVSLRETKLILDLWSAETNFESLDAIATKNPDKFLPHIFDMISGSLDSKLSFSHDQISQLAAHGKEIVAKWIHERLSEPSDKLLNQEVLACAISSIDIRSIRIQAKNDNGWASLLVSAGSNESKAWKIMVLKIFCSAMSIRSKHGGRISALAFPHVYQMCRKSKLSDHEWLLLEKTIQPSGWTSKLNKCRTLFEWLIERFMKFQWPKSYFAKMMSENRELANHLKKTRFRRYKYEKFVARHSSS